MVRFVLVAIALLAACGGGASRVGDDPQPDLDALLRASCDDVADAEARAAMTAAQRVPRSMYIDPRPPRGLVGWRNGCVSTVEEGRERVLEHAFQPSRLTGVEYETPHYWEFEFLWSSDDNSGRIRWARCDYWDRDAAVEGAPLDDTSVLVERATFDWYTFQTLPIEGDKAVLGYAVEDLGDTLEVHLCIAGEVDVGGGGEGMSVPGIQEGIYSFAKADGAVAGITYRAVRALK